MSETIKIEIPTRYIYVPAVRRFIARMSANFGFDERGSYQIETVVDEICNNAIEYGAKKKNTKIDIECTFSNGAIELIVVNADGKDFNPEEVLNRNFELLDAQSSEKIYITPKRGRGLLIVKKLVDKLDIKTGKKGTTVKILKKVKRA